MHRDDWHVVGHTIGTALVHGRLSSPVSSKLARWSQNRKSGTPLHVATVGADVGALVAHVPQVPGQRSLTLTEDDPADTTRPHKLKNAPQPSGSWTPTHPVVGDRVGLATVGADDGAADGVAVGANEAPGGKVVMFTSVEMANTSVA